MKIFTVLFVAILVGLLISAGCTSSENSAGTESPKFNEASTIFTQEENIGSSIIGLWKVQASDQQVIYWQFYNDGTLTGGSEPSSHEITGTWVTFDNGDYFVINASGTNSNGEQVTYNMALIMDLTNGTFSVDYPDEDKNWEFIRQP
jgi:hypothetical protein